MCLTQSLHVQGFLKNERENALLAVIEHTRKNVRFSVMFVACIFSADPWLFWHADENFFIA